MIKFPIKILASATMGITIIGISIVSFQNREINNNTAKMVNYINRSNSTMKLGENVVTNQNNYINNLHGELNNLQSNINTQNNEINTLKRENNNLKNKVKQSISRDNLNPFSNARFVDSLVGTDYPGELLVIQDQYAYEQAEIQYKYNLKESEIYKSGVWHWYYSKDLPSEKNQIISDEQQLIHQEQLNIIVQNSDRNQASMEGVKENDKK